MALQPFRLHNYAHDLGFALAPGACEALLAFCAAHGTLIERFNCPSIHVQGWNEGMPRFIGYVIFQAGVLSTKYGLRRKITASDLTYVLSLINGLGIQ